MSEVDWTTTPPTIPGYYWIIGFWVGGVHICQMNERGELWDERGGYWTDLTDLLARYGPYYWLGPLTPPAPPQ